MPNPWLAISLEDYEGHMGSDDVRQLEPLSDLFRRALDLCRPESIAVLGVAVGNGLERVDCTITKRIVGVDIHAGYLGVVQQRYGTLPGLELCCADLANMPASLTPVALVHAALIFEHKRNQYARQGKLLALRSFSEDRGNDRPTKERPFVPTL